MNLKGQSAKAAKRLGSKPAEGQTVMAVEAPGQQPGKPRKRVAGKAGERVSVSKVKATIHLTVEASQRLDIHATMMGMDRSALVEKLINDHLRRYVVSDRGGPDNLASAEAAA